MDRQLFGEVVLAAHQRGLLSDRHVTVDAMLIEAAARLRSFKPRDADPSPDDGDRGNPSVDFLWGAAGQRRPEHHDPEAKPFRKGKRKEASLVFLTHGLIENPQRPAGELPGERSYGDGGTGCDPRAAGRGARTRVPPQDSRCGQGRRHGELRGNGARPRRYPGRGAEHERALQRQQDLVGRRLAILVVLSKSWARIRRRVGDMRAAAREMGPGESREVPI